MVYKVLLEVHVLLVEHNSAFWHDNNSMLGSFGFSEARAFSLVDVCLLRLVEWVTQTAELTSGLESQILTIEAYVKNTYANHVQG